MQAPARGTAAVPRYDFPASFSEFSFRTLLTKAEIIQALGKLRAECNKVTNMWSAQLLACPHQA